jgi:guanosine-3',5'-bis(diphosphate) 3'-pyrophosphohydrolase
VGTPVTSLPRMQVQTRIHAPREPTAQAATGPVEPAVAAPKPMMRQYELVERVRQYNPKTNEDLLNRAYVYAMKAHGGQRRASGDP